MVGRVSENALATQWACCRSFYRGRGEDIDAPHDTEIKTRIYENSDSESAYNESHLFVVYTSLTITIFLINIRNI
jgi:hypothetical protein